MTSHISKLVGIPSAIILDFDGVFTSNLVVTTDTGQEAVISSKYDSLMIKKFKNDTSNSIPILVVSSEKNSVVHHRCLKLNIEYVQSSTCKISDAKRFLTPLNICLSECMFICNDFNDIPLVKQVGYSVCVNDAPVQMKNICQFHTHRNGGQGAIRETLEIVLENIKPFAAMNELRGISSKSPHSFNCINVIKPEEVGPRDWGEEFMLGKLSGNFTFKRLLLKQGSKGGLQYHRKKHEFGYIVSGKLIIRHVVNGVDLIESVFSEGDVFEFPPFSIHQEEAITDCEIIEVSTPFLNDRVRVESQFGIDDQSGLPTTSLDDIIEI